MKETDASVRYRLYRFAASEQQTLATIKEEKTKNAEAETWRKECAREAKRFLGTYVWNDREFALEVVPQEDVELQCIGGCVRFGDAIEDEWTVVSVLEKLSSLYADAVVTVEDDDGQFLLAEAAEVIPEWMTPETTTNRVYISNGFVHFITPAMLKSPVTPRMALSLIASSPRETRANANVQSVIKTRIQSTRSATWTHSAWCVLPVHVAYCVEQKPAVVARAVNAFYRRDDRDAKTASTLRVTVRGHGRRRRAVRVLFSKSCYAKLESQSFHPPKGLESYVPSSEKDVSWRACTRGLKLCAALETLAWRDESIATLLRRDKNDEVERDENKSSSYSTLRASPSCDFEDDSDAWMIVTPEHVDNMMKKYEFDEDAMMRELDQDEHDETPPLPSFPSAVASAMRRFVDHDGVTMDGAELPRKQTHDGEYDEDSSDSDEDGPITIRPNVLRNVLSLTSDTVDTTVPRTSQYIAGEKLTIIGLRSRPEYNGRRCHVVRRVNETGRYAVAFVDDHGRRKTLSVRPECLTRRLEQKTLMMSEMDAELMGTEVDKSFNGAALQHVRENEELNVDENLVRSLMESFEMQHGLSGPTSTILSGMDISIPKNADPK